MTFSKPPGRCFHLHSHSYREPSYQVASNRIPEEGVYLSVNAGTGIFPFIWANLSHISTLDQSLARGYGMIFKPTGPPLGVRKVSASSELSGWTGGGGSRHPNKIRVLLEKQPTVFRILAVMWMCTWTQTFFPLPSVFLFLPCIF
jgi:hypothetical protein